MSNQWLVDGSHSNAHFSVRHMMITNVRGEFQKVEGKVTWDPAKPEATQIEASVDVGSLNTRDAQRDGHLKSADFFDVEKFPKLTFKSKSVKAKGKENLTVVGDLTIHGVTKEVTLDVEGPSPASVDPFGNTRVGATASTKIKRDEFGMVWNAALEAGGVLVGNDVNVTIDISLIQQK
ncbi:MAG TPA: YceI family protein [Polyangiaceae bacterium]|jgi:polyisoprenoid-binding protein YceI|nr:YceI family protein [Polyangiaceae bacterium]